MRFRVLICLFAFALIGCKKSSSIDAASPNEPQAFAESSVAPQIQACSLITNDEVSAIQKTPITGAQSSQSSDGIYVISLCYYASGEPNKSVSFALTEPDQRKPTNSDPRNYWKQTFGRYSGNQPEGAEEEKEKEEAKTGKREEEHEKAAPPKKIEGIGEQAYWAGNRFGGALYVLKKNYVLRVSVGGPDNEETKISKSKALAEKAIARL